MSCNETRVNLPAYIRNELSAPALGRLSQHLDGCQKCRKFLASERALDQALRQQFTVPEPAPDFRSRVFSAARSGSSAKSGWSHTMLGGAIAAALAVGITVGVVLQPAGLTDNGPSVVDVPGTLGDDQEAPITAPVQKTVRLAFRSGEALENVTLTLEFPPNAELASWPGHRELSWRVSLDAGENVLSLPLNVLFPGAGELVARLDTGDRQKTFRAPIPQYPDGSAGGPES